MRAIAVTLIVLAAACGGSVEPVPAEAADSCACAHRYAWTCDPAVCDPRAPPLKSYSVDPLTVCGQHECCQRADDACPSTCCTEPLPR